MTKALTTRLEGLALLLTAFGVGMMLSLNLPHKTPLPRSVSLPVVALSVFPTPVDTGPLLPKPTFTSQVSPDGQKLLTMTASVRPDETKKYVFFIADFDGNNKKLIYSVTYNKNAPDTMSIPFNTWSPDDKYIFLNHNDGLKSEAIVLLSDGAPIIKEEKTINLTNYFISKITNNSYKETTGWASESLLIVNTQNPNGEKGLSYWVEMPTQYIVPLATQF